MDIQLTMSLVENCFSDYCISTHQDKTQEIKFRWPDIAIGRIPARTSKEANLMIDNIIDFDEMNYQNEIFRNLTLVSYFQDSGPGAQDLDHEASKDYLQCVEEIRLNLESYTKVDMVYKTENTGITVDEHEYRDGTKLDKKAINFLDDDTAKDKIVNAFREGGRFIVHRDHGWMNGWAYPNFKIPDLWKINCSSNEPSIVFNINCLSGRFTGENFGSSSVIENSEICADSIKNRFNMPKCSNDSFSEVLLKGTILPNGNHLNLKCPAVIASTEVSPSFENDWLIKIMFDTIYGGILSGKPKNEEDFGQQRIGDVLNVAKILLNAYQGDREMHIYENVVFHILGDPTLKV